jgi:pilus assembly protein CpaF
MSISEQEELLDDICNDVLGYGPLEPLLSRDDIADIRWRNAARIFPAGSFPRCKENVSGD